MNRLELEAECFLQAGRLEEFTGEKIDGKYTSSAKRLLYLLNKNISVMRLDHSVFSYHP